MSIDRSFDLISFLFGAQNIVKKDENEFIVKIDQQHMNFYYDEKKGIIFRKANNQNLHVNKAHLFNNIKFKNGMISMTEANITNMCNVNADCNKFCKNTIFTGIQMTKNIYQLTGIGYLNVCLEKEWNDIKGIRAKKYILLREATKNMDIALVITSIICLLGHYNAP